MPSLVRACVLSAAVGEDWSRQRVVMVGRRGFQRREFLSLSGRRCQDMLTDPIVGPDYMWAKCGLVRPDRFQEVLARQFRTS